LPRAGADRIWIKTGFWFWPWSKTRADHPGIPWQDIVGMRNRLIHAYFDINLEVVWSTITSDLPALISELEKIPLS
jgi:uncharacterized protein with HEPN domain